MKNMLMKRLFKLLFCLLLLVNVTSSSQTTPDPNPKSTSGGANSALFKFTKEVWLNPSIILMNQRFEQETHVKLLLLPRFNSKDTTAGRLEKAFDKVLSLLVFKDDVDGSIKFYFDPKNKTKPFSFGTSEDLWCKFTRQQIDTVEQLLNAQLTIIVNLENFSALPFDSIISQAGRYCKSILLSHPDACGPDPENEFSLSNLNCVPAKLNFEKVEQSNLPTNGAVDEQKYPAFAQYYNTVIDLSDKSNYPIAWKAVAVNKNDVIRLKITKKEKDFNFSRLVFKNASGTEKYYPVFDRSDSTVITLSITGKPAGSMLEIVANYTTAAGQTYAVGAFNIHFYQPKSLTLMLWDVDGGGVDVEKIQTELNKIYGNVFINWTVKKVSGNLKLPATTNRNIHVEGSGLLSNYMSDMKPIINYFKDNCADYDAKSEDTYYMVLGCKNDNSLSGYMPRARNIGFTFNNDPHTIAHELGHGAFGLKHIFSNDELGEGYQYQTDNLMDYPGEGTSAATVQNALYKYQWDLIYNPDFVGWFEGDDEEGSASEFATIDDTPELLFPETLITKTFYFADETKYVKVKFDKSITTKDYVVSQNGKDYILMYKKASLQFSGFYDRVEIDNKKKTDDKGNIQYVTTGVTSLKQGTDYTVLEEGEYRSHTPGYVKLLNTRTDITQEQVEKLANAINKTSSIALEELLKNADIILPPSPCYESSVDNTIQLAGSHKITSACWDYLINNIGKVMNNALNKCSDIITLINKTTITSANRDEINEKIGALSNTDYGLFTAKERLLILSYFTTGNMSDNVFTSHNEESYALKLLKYADTNQAEELLTGLENTPVPLKATALKPEYSNSLLYNLDKKIDGSNYTYFATIIKNLLLSSKKLSTKYTDAINSGDVRMFIIGIKTSSETVGLIKLSDASWQGDKISVMKSQVEAVDAIMTIEEKEAIHYTKYVDKDLTPFTLSPFDLVFIYNFSGNKNILAALEADDKLLDGKVALVPAYLLKFADKKLTNEAIEDGITTSAFIALDILTIIKGVPAFSAIKAAYRAEEITRTLMYVKTAYNALEITTAVGNLTLNSLKDEIPEESVFRDLVDASNVLMLVSTLPQLPKAIGGAYSTVKNVVVAGKKIITKEILARAIARIIDQEANLIAIKNKGNAASKEAEALLNAKNTYTVEAESYYGKTDWENTVALYKAGTTVRYIAKSGEELRVYLSKVNKPNGKTYIGDVYRSLSKVSEINYGALPGQMTDHYIYSSWGRYDLPGEENAMYLSKTITGNKTELVPHYGAWEDFSTYEYSG